MISLGGDKDMRRISVGLDIGSTTIKVVVLSEEGKMIDFQYVPHHYRVREELQVVLGRLAERFPLETMHLAATGMGAMELSSVLKVPFVQEVVAEGLALRTYHRQVDVAIELGGEDAKVTYFETDGKTDQRMNRMCAGGTGAFLEHMASFFGVTMEGLNHLAACGQKVYPIASRCGVYATTDMQALLNQSVSRENLALSAFQAVVNQVISDLAKGRPLEGNVAFLGGPLTFLPELRKRFVKTLALSEERCIFPAHGELYAALGTALWGRGQEKVSLSSLRQRLTQGTVSDATLLVDPLFSDAKAYERFQEYYRKFQVPCLKDGSWPEQVWLGIDAGSTTMKIVLVDKKGQVVHQRYRKNEARIWETAREMLLEMYADMPSYVKVVASGVTGYGEGFLKVAFQLDYGEVETMAHLRAARFFCPEVTDLLDIGGQDMKYISLKEGIIQKVVLNGSCASGCGLFLETFAKSLGLSMEKFVRSAVEAKHQLDLGYRCTVLMNSKIHQLQNENIETGDLIAGLCMSVVKNALYRVIHLQDIHELGDHIVVEGGTFYNDAVLRSFEKLVGHPVIRPDLSGLMGAYGMALLAKERRKEGNSTVLSVEEIKSLSVEEAELSCQGCGNHCVLQKKKFSTGQVYLTGNRCSRGIRLAGHGFQAESHAPNLNEWEKDHVFLYRPPHTIPKGTVGMVRGLGNWSDFPFWQTFWAALGYRTVVSDFEMEEMGKCLSTIPQGVYCYPCKIAHGHLMQLLEKKKPDFTWMPVTQKGIEEPELDELEHSSYGDVLATAMHRQIEKAEIPFFHPHVFSLEKDMISFMENAFPLIPSAQVKEALRQAEEGKKKYLNQLKEKTQEILQWIETKKKQAIVLLGRNYHVDPEINKGLPAVIAGLGIPVLTAEGLYQLQDRPKENPTFSDLALYATEQVVKHPYLHLVQLQSTSCGYDGMTMQDIRNRLEQAGEIYTILNLDQGMSTGALQIRIRSLMAEIEERKAHPECIPKAIVKSVEQVIPQTIYLEPMGGCYDALIKAAWEGAGFVVKDLDPSWLSFESLPKEADDVSEMGQERSAERCEEAVLVISSWKRTQQIRRCLRRNGVHCEAMFLGMGRKRNDCFLSTSLLHRLWMALFLGDVLLRCQLSLEAMEEIPGEIERLLLSAVRIGMEAVRRGTFAGYQKALSQCVHIFSSVQGKHTVKRRVGLLGNPRLAMELAAFLQKGRKGTFLPIMQGWGEWLLNELTELYFIEGFQGQMEKAQVCMASRSTAHTCLEMVLAVVNQVHFLDTLETPDEKKEHLNRFRKKPEKYVSEPYRDLLRRHAEQIISMNGSDRRSSFEIEKLKKFAPMVSVLSLQEDDELSLSIKNRVEMFLEKRRFN